MSEDLKELLADVSQLRTSFKSNGRLNLEFKAAISSLLRTYGIEISDATLAKLVVALPEEVDSGVAVVLPTPSLPPR